jgi:hypothetical protein
MNELAGMLAGSLGAELDRLRFPESAMPRYHIRVSELGEWTYRPGVGIRAGLDGEPTALVEITRDAIEKLLAGECSPVDLFTRRLVRVGGIGSDLLALRDLWGSPEAIAESNRERLRVALSIEEKRRQAAGWRAKLGERGAAVARVARMIDSWAEHRTSECTLDMWTTLDLEGLENRPWHDPAEVTFEPIMEASFSAMREEALRLLSGEVRAPHYGAARSSLDEPVRGRPRGWRHWSFVEYFERQDQACAAFPAGAAVVETIASHHAVIHASYLILEPHTVIPPHSDAANWCLSYHHGVIVPPGCHQTVAGERRDHAERRSMLFEDCFVHSAANESDEARVILNVVFANPTLSADETMALRCLATELPSGALAYPM